MALAARAFSRFARELIAFFALVWAPPLAPKQQGQITTPLKPEDLVDGTFLEK